MKYRNFGSTGWQVSAIGMGCWGIGGQWGQVADREALDTVQAALDAGINFFDTADTYGVPLGRSETLVGQALKGQRDKVYIASKVGNWARRAGHPLAYSSPEHIILCCHASLYRLQTDYIDFYQCHIGNLEDPDVFLEAFERLHKEGKVRAYGISTNSLEVLKRFNRDGNCTGCQLDYSLLNREPERELLPYCQEHSIATLIRGPLAKGLLSGKFSSESHFEDSVRENWNDQRRDWFLEKLGYVESIRFLESLERTLAQAALQFVLAHPAVTCAIPGAKSPAQMQANAAAADGEIKPDDWRKLQGSIKGWA